MKKYIPFLLAGILLLGASCDDDEDTFNSTMNFNGTSVKIDQVYYYSYGYNEETPNGTISKTEFRLFIPSEGVVLADKGTYDEFEGDGKLFAFYVDIVDSVDELPAGDYEIEAESYNMADGDWDFVDGFEGDFIVKKSGDTYTLEFSKTGSPVYSMSYRGSIDEARFAR